MKKFSFSLQRLLDYRKQMLDLERSKLANVNAALRSFEDELAAFKDERVRRARDYQDAIIEGLTPLDMEIYRNYLRTLDDNIFHKGVQVDMQRKVVEKQMDKVRETNMEITIMEKLKENRLAEYNYLDQKEQELFIEEFVTNKKVTGDGQASNP